MLLRSYVTSSLVLIVIASYIKTLSCALQPTAEKNMCLVILIKLLVILMIRGHIFTQQDA